jgi:putative spermidine/putrescine transport system permease protein
MFTGTREWIGPCILALATLMAALSALLLITLEMRRRRCEWWRALNPA